jgi:hypothetical protein
MGGNQLKKSYSTFLLHEQVESSSYQLYAMVVPRKLRLSLSDFPKLAWLLLTSWLLSTSC